MYSVTENPLKNLTFPSDDFDHYRFIRWIQSEVMEENPNYVRNPELDKADKILLDHIVRLSLSDSETDDIISEHNSVEAAAASEAFVNGFLTALAITQGRVL